MTLNVTEINTLSLLSIKKDRCWSVLEMLCAVCIKYEILIDRIDNKWGYHSANNGLRLLRLLPWLLAVLCFGF